MPIPFAFHTSWLEFLCCPDCHADLALDGTSGVKNLEVAAGKLSCHGCGNVFPILDGIARFVIDTDVATVEEEIKRRERGKRDEEAELYDGMFTGYRNQVETDAILRQLVPTSDDVIVELGAGTGRITTAYAYNVKKLIAVDFSAKSLGVLRRRLDRSPSEMCLIMADISKLPFRSSVFDKAVSAQVLEHLPSSNSRSLAITELARILRDKGVLILTAYYYSPEKKLRHRRNPADRTNQEGFHSDGAIYYYNFGFRELKRALERTLQVRCLRGVLQERPYLERFGNLGLLLERIAQCTLLGRFSAHLLLAKAQKAKSLPGAMHPEPTE